MGLSSHKAYNSAWCCTSSKNPLRPLMACDHLPFFTKIRIRPGKNKKKQTFQIKPEFRQSWTEVLGTVLQYLYFCVISSFPLKTAHPFRNFLAVLPPSLPHTLYKVKNRTKIPDTRFQHCFWGEGRG